MSEAPISKCPECGGKSERLLSGGAGFIFKGDGFYITDSRSDDYKKAASSESDGASSGTKGSGKSKGSSADAKSTGSTKESSTVSKDSSAKPSSSD